MALIHFLLLLWRSVQRLGSSISRPGDSPSVKAAAQARDNEISEAQVKAFAAGVPAAKVIRLPNANHYLFISNSGDVWHEMNNFLQELQ
jgi:non-heme chloroperoxidase